VDFPDDDSMRVSHDAIYQALYIQGRGALRRELIACLRTGRALRVPRARPRRRDRAFVGHHSHGRRSEPRRFAARTHPPDQIDFNNKAVLQGPLEVAQYVSLVFGQAAGEAGIARSMGSKGDCYDNAVAESFFATLKKELVHRRSWPTRRELMSEVFEYIEAFYNRARRHSSLGYRSPADYENRTLITGGTSLAASRLGSRNQEIK
jgi:hypothetical protein